MKVRREGQRERYGGRTCKEERREKGTKLRKIFSRKTGAPLTKTQKR